MNYQPPFQPQGYNCPSCGLLVQSGALHTCFGVTTPRPSPPTVDVRIAVALERCAAALEALAKESA